MKTIFEIGQITGGLKVETGTVGLVDARRYVAQAEGDGLSYTFPSGFLSGFEWLSADFFLEGQNLVVFSLTLQEGESGPCFGLNFGLLNQCQARMRVSLDAVNQNRWRYEREGAWLKPQCWGDRVDLGRVDRMKIQVLRKSSETARFEMTAVTASQEEPKGLEQPLLPAGPLIDTLGQNRLRQWAGKSLSTDEVTERLRRQLQEAPAQRWPDHFSGWGGWKEKQFGGSGFFRTAQEGGRWWLVDPEGYAFWSAGLDCVFPDTAGDYRGLTDALEWLPDAQGEYAAAFKNYESPRDGMINYLSANLIRAFGGQDWYARWAEIALAELRRIGFNTVANWSDWRAARAAGMPYVRPLTDSEYSRLPGIYRDFPDVFHPDFPAVCARTAEQLRDTRDDPAFIGYFLMNEPTWGFAQLTPAEGMLFNTSDCHARRALAEWLRERYGADDGLAAAWGMAEASLERVGGGKWDVSLTEAARADLTDFSSILVERFFGGLSAACRQVDPNHLNLGIRYYTVPPAWAMAGMRHFDVFSMNCYKQRLPAAEMEQISTLLGLPIMIGEWHFGALDAGLAASGIGHTRDQAGRGKAYRIYVEDAAAKPWCVGVHYFILYDQSALGRFDGENYNIGFVDVCHRPYEALCAAARASHERMYSVAAGLADPFNDAPEYLPLLFL